MSERQDEPVESTPAGQPSFVREVRTRRGRLIRRIDFKLPDASHAEGLTRGRLAALEYFRHLCSRHAAAGPSFAAVVKAAADGLDVPGQSGNAAGFLAAVERMVFFALRHSNFEAEIAGAIASRATQEARTSAQEALRKRELVARLKSGRDARRLLAAIAAIAATDSATLGRQRPATAAGASGDDAARGAASSGGEPERP